MRKITVTCHSRNLAVWTKALPLFRVAEQWVPFSVQPLLEFLTSLVLPVKNFDPFKSECLIRWNCKKLQVMPHMTQVVVVQFIANVLSCPHLFEGGCPKLDSKEKSSLQESLHGIWTHKFGFRALECTREYIIPSSVSKQSAHSNSNSIL